MGDVSSLAWLTWRGHKHPRHLLRVAGVIQTDCWLRAQQPFGEKKKNEAVVWLGIVRESVPDPRTGNLVIYARQLTMFMSGQAVQMKRRA